MKVVQINAVCGKGSTGHIAVSISKILTLNNIENYIMYSSGTSDYPLGVKYTSNVNVKFNALASKLFGNYGFTAKLATKKLIKRLRGIKPNVVHLHNLHAHNVHVGMLFDYLRENGIKVFWTFHDCWAFTGYCTHFDMIKCQKWKKGCFNCSQSKRFSWLLDKSTRLYADKKQALSGLDLTIITPSKWMADLVKDSFLGCYPIKVINNGIDLTVFHPVVNDFRSRYGLENKFVILGVAFDWGYRKGLDVFIELSKRLGNDYKIILVGTNDKVDKLIPSNIISIHRTQNQAELAEIYSAVDVFINPTREETFPTVNMEALACGTPVVTFNSGGSPEILDEKCGVIVDRDDVSSMEKAIINLKANNFLKEDCVERAKRFDKNISYKKYLFEYLQ